MRGAARHAVILGAAIACAGPRVASVQPPTGAEPARPASCRSVSSLDDLQETIDGAPDGAAICLAAGAHRGPVHIDHPLVLWGPRAAVIRSNGEGDTVRIRADGVQLLGLTVSGSGHRFDLVDAGVHVDRAADVRVEGVLVDRATFGIVVDRSERVVIRGDEIVGTADVSLGMRGDAIRVWETEDSLIEGNDVRDSRDVVIWYSPRSRVEGNRVERSRYGTHLMYSRDAVVVRNRYVADEVGVFVMYTRNARIEDDVMADAAGAAGMGLGLKDSSNVVARGDQFIHDTVGLYVDTSPAQPGDVDVFDHDVFRLDDVGVVFHSTPHATRFTYDSFRDNGKQVRVDGGGDALGIEWAYNDFDDYAGYDLDGDGIGDVPYELRSLSTQLTDRYPGLAFFQGTPVLALIEVAGRVLPVFSTPVILRDAHPRMTALPAGGDRAD